MTMSKLEKCPNTEFFWSVFSCIRAKYGDLRSPNTGKNEPERTQNLDIFHALRLS